MITKMNAAILTAAALALGTPSAAEPSAQAPRDPNAAEVERFFMEGIAAFNAHDTERFLTQFHPEMRMFAVTNWLRGDAEIRERFQQVFAAQPNVRMEIADLHAHSVTPDVVIVEFKWATFPTGEGSAWRGVGSGVYVRTPGGWREVLEHETLASTDPGLPSPKAR